MDLQKLLAPRSVAIVGATEKEGFGRGTCHNVLEYTTGEHVYFINPKRSSVFGKPCYPSLTALPYDIDLVVLCTPQKTVEPLLREAAAKGVGGAVVYASGYAETGTAEGLQAESSLQALCKELDIALMGPNCAGFMNYNNQVAAFAFVSKTRDRKGSVGVISQSGQLCLSLMDSPDMSFSYCISAGNSAVLTIEDYLDYLIDDQETKVIGLYLEGVTRPQLFLECLRKAALIRKPIVVLKAGRSIKGALVAASHTGSLAGSDRVYDAVFKKFGVIRVDDLEELLATTVLFSTLPHLPKNSGFAAISLSGGETSICADLGEIYGINYPDFSEKTLAALDKILPDYCTPANPLDSTATISYDTDAYAATLQAVTDDPDIDMILIGYTLLLEISDPAIYFITEAIEKVVQGGRSKPMAMLPFMENTRNMKYLDKLAKLGVPVLPPPIYAFKALKHLKNFISYDPKAHTLQGAVPSRSSERQGCRILSEFESVQMLAEYGIPVSQGKVVSSKEEAVAVAESIGYPVVLKIASADIAHKSDTGGVALNLADARAVETAYTGIMDNVQAKAPQAKVDGILVKHMLEPGLEVIIGVSNDPQFGPCILCGLGGIFVEIFKDTALLLVPVTKKEAHGMLLELQSLPLLAGYRGGKVLDTDALADLITHISSFAASHCNTLSELDINPVFVYEKGKGVGVADALLVLYE